MISKHLNTLELPKILGRLANHCSFTASIALAQQLTPSTNAAEVQRRLAETSEAKEALLKNDNSEGRCPCFGSVFQAGCK